MSFGPQLGFLTSELNREEWGIEVSDSGRHEKAHDSFPCVSLPMTVVTDRTICSEPLVFLIISEPMGYFLLFWQNKAMKMYTA